MGLDMELRRVSKPHLDPNRVYRPSEIDGVVIPEEQIDLPMYRELRPYTQKIRVLNEHLEMDKLRSDHGLGRHSYICTYGNRGASVFDPDTSELVEISCDDMDTKYTSRRVETGYACLTEEIRYWRKAYDVQEWFYQQLDDRIVESTGFYLLTREDLERFNERWRETIDEDSPNDESAIYYWEWY